MPLGPKTIGNIAHSFLCQNTYGIPTLTETLIKTAYQYSITLQTITSTTLNPHWNQTPMSALLLHDRPKPTGIYLNKTLGPIAAAEIVFLQQFFGEPLGLCPAAILYKFQLNFPKLYDPALLQNQKHFKYCRNN